MSSSSEGSDFDEEQTVAKLKRSFNAYKWPLLASLVLELLWCFSLYSWLKVNDVRYQYKDIDVKAGKGHLTDVVSYDRYHALSKCWVVFGVCLLARGLVFWCWKKHFCRLLDSTYSAWFMFFSSIQWPLYVICYYLLLNDLMDVKATPEVQVLSPSQYLKDMMVSNKTSGAHGQPMMMPDCLENFSPTECVSKVNLEVHCKTEFDPNSCSGYSWIGNGADSKKCCVKTVFSLVQPNSIVPPTPYSMSTLASLFTVLSTLCIWWAINNTPMLPAWGSASSFTSGVWLDIMDSVTFIQTYATSKAVVNPKFGISKDGMPCPESADMYFMLMTTAFVAFISSIVAPALYTLLRRTNRETASTSSRTVDEALADAATSVRLLDATKAEAMVSEAMQLQKEQYKHDSEEKSEDISVVVFPDTASFDDPNSKSLVSDVSALVAGADDDCRPGTARRQSHGLYTVHYVDGQEPASEEGVPVWRLRPEMQSSHDSCGPQCCTGWCHPSRLCKGSAQENFENRAIFFEAVRSFFLLELPFLCWRWYFEHAGLNVFSFAWVLMLKNLMWGAQDLMTILGFGNTAATCFGHVPVQFLNRTVNGTSLGGMMLMGEGGIVLIGHQLLQKAVQGHITHKLDLLRTQRAWLLVERSKALEEGDTLAMDAYDKQADQLNEMIEDEEKKKSLRVM